VADGVTPELLLRGRESGPRDELSEKEDLNRVVEWRSERGHVGGDYVGSGWGYVGSGGAMWGTF
jgi:hypothetical protein